MRLSHIPMSRMATAKGDLPKVCNALTGIPQQMATYLPRLLGSTLLYRRRIPSQLCPNSCITAEGDIEARMGETRCATRSAIVKPANLRL